ncbi:MAG: alkaline phosphatase family protein [bacterium]
MKRKRSAKIGLVVLSFCILIAVIVAVSLTVQKKEETDSGNRTKVLFVGMDSMNWTVLNPLLEKGKLPNIGRLIDEGVSGPLMSRPITNSPIIWTTIATGKQREEHGITGFFSDGAGEKGSKPYTSADRKVAALWNIMGMRNRTVGCFGWWVTWPAEQVNGVMVSAFTAMNAGLPVSRGIDQNRIINNLTWPEEYFGEIKPLLVSKDSITHEDLAQFVNITDWNHPMFQYKAYAEGVNYVLPWTYSTDLSYVNMAEYCLEKKQLDLTMVYIQGTDSCSHRFWMCRDDVEGLHDNLVRYHLPAEMEKDFRAYFGETIDKYYEFADELIGRLLAQIDDNTVVILCSDHGFGTLEDPWPDGEKEFTLYGGHLDEGSIVIWGPGIRSGKKLKRERMPYIWDVTPTILVIMGLPLAQDMVGTPIWEAFDARFMQDFKAIAVETYDVNFKSGEKPKEIPMDSEYEERLRSLGYIQ